MFDLKLLHSQKREHTVRGLYSIYVCFFALNFTFSFFLLNYPYALCLYFKYYSTTMIILVFQWTVTGRYAKNIKNKRETLCLPSVVVEE